MSIKPIVMAEACCNHMGSLDIAKRMIEVASTFSNANIIKFQKRNVKENLSPERYHGPHPEPNNSFGKTYGEHREALEFSIEAHESLKEYCEKLNIIYAVSVFDLTSAKECISIASKIIKIPSALNLDFKILEYVCKNHFGEIHISTGMTSFDELNSIIDFVDSHSRLKDTVIYACTSSYPCDYKDLYLNYIKKLYDLLGSKVKGVGFSGHHNGIAADVAALTLGARWFERHFTLDRAWKGTDQAASLEPDGLRKLIRDLSNVSMALQDRPAGILEVEKFNHHFHKENKALK
jgi:sialic acid synthase